MKKIFVEKYAENLFNARKLKAMNINDQETVKTERRGSDSDYTVCFCDAQNRLLREERYICSELFRVSKFGYSENSHCEFSTYFHKSYFSDAVEECYFYSEYDASGNKTLQISSHTFDADNNYFVWEYSNSGIKTGSLHHFCGGEATYTISVCDSDGNDIRITYCREDGSVIYYYENEYDENNKIIRSTLFDGKGTAKEYKLYEYRENGKNLRTSYYKPNGKLRYVETHEYNDSGEHIGWTWRDAKGNISRVNICHHSIDHFLFQDVIFGKKLPIKLMWVRKKALSAGYPKIGRLKKIS